jgi:hypothetical protein
VKSAHVIGIAFITFVLGVVSPRTWMEPDKQRQETETVPPPSVSPLSLPDSSSLHPAAPTPSISTERCTAAAPNDTALRQDIARILRDELREVLAVVNTEAENVRIEEAKIQEILNSPANREAYQGSHDLVRAALVAGRWTDDDAQALQAALPYLTQDQTMEVFEVLLPAMNRGEIAVETNGPPF